MSAAGIIVCRLFSGPHLGAELVLPAGQQVIGADDSCDVILQDGSVASRHAVLDIAFDADGTASVRVTPLDGEVLLDERPLPPDGAIIPERTPFFLRGPLRKRPRRRGGKWRLAFRKSGRRWKRLPKRRMFPLMPKSRCFWMTLPKCLPGALPTMLAKTVGGVCVAFLPVAWRFCSSC